jgi:hypothetical protein
VTFEAAKKLRVGETLSKSPHPAFGHLLPSFGREKAEPLEIIAFSRALAWEKVPDRADEGPLFQSHNCAAPRTPLFSPCLARTTLATAVPEKL